MNKKPLIEGKRECIRCKEYKPIEEFSLMGKAKKLRSCCKPCEIERVTEHGQNIKARGVAYLGGECVCCGYSRCFASLQYHHVDPSKKEFTIGKKKSLKWESIRQELDKCILVCSNCHYEIHDGSILLEFH